MGESAGYVCDGNRHVSCPGHAPVIAANIADTGFHPPPKPAPAPVQEDMIQLYLQVMDHQLQQLWHGFGVSFATNRTLVMPNLKCFCTRNWCDEGSHNDWVTVHAGQAAANALHELELDSRRLHV